MYEKPREKASEGLYSAAMDDSVLKGLADERYESTKISSTSPNTVETSVKSILLSLNPRLLSSSLP